MPRGHISQELLHSLTSKCPEKILVNSGCSLYEVQKILGHYDPKVTMRYAHLAQPSLVRAANMIAKCVSGENRQQGVKEETTSMQQ